MELLGVGVVCSSSRSTGGGTAFWSRTKLTDFGDLTRVDVCGGDFFKLDERFVGDELGRDSLFNVFDVGNSCDKDDDEYKEF